MALLNSNSSTLMKVVASSVAIARRSGVIIRGIMKGGDLGIIDKVACVKNLLAQMIYFVTSCVHGLTCIFINYNRPVLICIFSNIH